jgi:acetyl esterase/lipase
MSSSLLRLCLIAVVATSASSISHAQPAQQLQGTTLQGTTLKGEGDFNAFAAQQAGNNGKPGPRQRPAETIPVPTEGVSAAVQALIATPFPPHMNAEPKNAAEWKDLIERRAALTRAAVPAMLEKLQVSVQGAVIGGVKCFIITPNNMPEANRNRLLVHVHGGGYVFSPGEAALPEALMIAGFGGFKVISVDYRMPPDFPYPAAMDDAMAVWKQAVTMADPKNMAILGTSTGGAMTLAMVLRAKSEGLPLPGAIAPGTPWSDIADIGDTYKTNEWVDNILVTWDGWLGRAARLYAAGHDLKDPQLSPIYGDFHGFPPALLTSGTRDLFLSNTVRTHRALKRAGVEADLNVYEGQSHAQYMGNIDAPETREAFTDIAKFFDKHLGK